METSKPREQLLEEEKRLKGEIEKKHGKTVEQLYDERERRWRDAIELREPDRVPVNLFTGVFAARYAGLTASAQYYDHAGYEAACRKTMLDFEPDICQTTIAANSGLVLELLDSKHQLWPGFNLPDDAPYQFIEGEYMKADEYDLFLNDPSDFVMRYYLPRVYGTLAPLSRLPPFRTMIGSNTLTAAISLFVRPEFQEFARKVYQAAQEQEKVRKRGVDFAEEMMRLGFPSPQGGGGVQGVPFDAVSDFLRGMRGSMLDMYRCPDKLLAACDSIMEWRIARAVPANMKTKGNPKTQGSALHRGSDGFMSMPQFEKFYWPQLKKLILTNIDLGYVCTPFFEGVWDQRLEYLLELPKGKVVFWFEKTDIFKAKEVLGGHICIQGGVPNSLLRVGTPQEVDEHCRKLIEVVGKGGGFIMAASGGGFDVAKPENVKAMVNSVRKYRPS